MSAIFAQRPIGPLASLDVTWWHVDRMLKSRHTRDLCVQSWSMVVQFGTPKAYCGHLYGKQLFTWLSLVVSFMASFVLSFFPLDVLDGIWDLIESVSEGFLTYFCKVNLRRGKKMQLDS